MGSIRKRDDNGLLFFDFRHRGQRCREQTALEDTPANHKRLQKVLNKIEEDIATGTFDYTKTFPTSKMAARFAGTATTAVATAAAVAAIGVPAVSGPAAAPSVLVPKVVPPISAPSPTPGWPRTKSPGGAVTAVR
jgi:integrase